MLERPWHQYYESDKANWRPTHADALGAFREAAKTAQGGITYFGRRWSFPEIDLASENLSDWAARNGIGAGDRVAIVLQNVPAFAIVAVAAWKLGAIPVPGNPAYRAAELARIFKDSRPSLVVCHPDHFEDIQQALLTAAISAVTLVVAATEHAEVPDFRIVPAGGSVASDHPRLAEALAGASSARPEAVIAPSDIGLILYTSGTTGEPKGAMLRHSSIVSNAELMADWVGVTSASRILGIAPLFHITGFVCHFLMAITKRCWLVLHYRFEADVVLDVIRHERPTYAVGAITAFNALSAVPSVSAADFASFEEVYSGGAPIAPALQETLKKRLGVDIRNCYGMTETSAPTHMTPRGLRGPVDPATGALSIGIPVWHTLAKIVDEQGVQLGPGVAGELWVSGPQITTGYWNKPEETAASLSDGWLHTGDVGFMDENGWFFLIDRKKDMINASGFKVWPREVEDALYAHPSVKEAAVIGEPHDYRGETVIAYVSIREDVRVDSAELVAHCRAVLAAYKVPREIHQLPELPKTVSGKILRRALRRGS